MVSDLAIASFPFASNLAKVNASFDPAPADKQDRRHGCGCKRIGGTSATIQVWLAPVLGFQSLPFNSMIYVRVPAPPMISAECVSASAKNT